ncbi:hypothetical protein ANN_20942 [Periplaneta americana]|uniref:Reverse transcriptase RNase H-like domain-containing protein n=1 Tax=Periplaneta americana TaxID=6978 RepID=A0ABQ8SEF7_PERAM|nr:hypothetical protein ANN_20942 [Periplaneta americana]
MYSGGDLWTLEARVILDPESIVDLRSQLSNTGLKLISDNNKASLMSNITDEHLSTAAFERSDRKVSLFGHKPLDSKQHLVHGNMVAYRAKMHLVYITFPKTLVQIGHPANFTHNARAFLGNVFPIREAKNRMTQKDRIKLHACVTRTREMICGFDGWRGIRGVADDGAGSSSFQRNDVMEARGWYDSQAGENSIFKVETVFLGYVISSDGFRPDKREFRALRGSRRRGTGNRWGSAEQEAFDRTKLLFADSILLERPNDSLPFQIYTDASSYGYGAILCQTDEDNKRHVIATASRGLSRTESNASITELEISAVYFALQKFRQYIFNRQIIIFTDHVSLAFLSRCKLTNSRISRYVHEILAHDVTIRHIPGADNIFGDCLSRLNSKSGLPETITAPAYEIAVMKMDSTRNGALTRKFRRIADLQQEDSTIRALMDKAREISQVKDEVYGLRSGILYKLHGRNIQKWKIYIPAVWRMNL